MKAIKYYGVFRGGVATMPIAAFAVKDNAEDYASRHVNMAIRECYMDCGYPCPSCGSLIFAANALPCDECELSNGCIDQPFTDGCRLDSE